MIFIVLYTLWCFTIYYYGVHVEDREVHAIKQGYKLDYGRAIEAKNRIRRLDQAVREFRHDTGKLPQDLKSLIVNGGGSKNWNGPYIEEIQNDPWGRPLIYRVPGKHGEFDILSLGADGKPGGDNVWGDIGNWNLDQPIEMIP